MISIRQLTYTYPGAEKPTLRPCDLEVDAGDFVLVAGASGSGKSTLLRVVNGLVPHFYGGTIRGRVRVDGRDPIALGPSRMADRVGFVGQDPEAHFVAEVVEDELAFAMENHDVAASSMAHRIEGVLDQLSIAALRHRRIDSLSGGEKQRVAIASVLTLQPEVLVLDEPTSQLDPRSADEVLGALVQLNHDFGLTVLVSEHRLERLLPYTDHLVLLDAQGAPRSGPPADLLAASRLAPPLVSLARALDWQPIPQHLKQARRHPALAELRRRLDQAPSAVAGSAERRGESVLEAEGLWFRYPRAERETLAGIDLGLERGTVTALLGRNGAGKSTLLASLVGLRRGDRGTVRLQTTDGTTLDPWSTPLDEVTRKIAFLPQDPSRLLFHDTVEQELRFSTRGRRSDSSTELLADYRDLGVEAWLDANPRDLSTGERQRVALAAVLATQPEVLLLDEPTRGLDAEAKARFASWLRAASDRGLTVLVATHDVEWIAACADRAMVLGDGRVVTTGPLAEVLGDSPVFAPQIARLLRDPRWLTVESVLQALGLSVTEPR